MNEQSIHDCLFSNTGQKLTWQTAKQKVTQLVHKSVNRKTIVIALAYVDSLLYWFEFEFEQSHLDNFTNVKCNILSIRRVLFELFCYTISICAEISLYNFDGYSTFVLWLICTKHNVQRKFQKSYQCKCCS